jgi:hypothetical protein
MLRMKPTDVFDIRPTIVVGLISLTMWRPYSLIRRILATLSRLRSDALIGSGYVFDLSAFGVLWWQLASWPAAGKPVDPGQADVLLGVSAAAAIGLGLGLGVWILITLDVERAEADRLLALRTRHDHRHLRLRGINPMDPEVRWALLRIRQEEELERRASHAADREPIPDAPVRSMAEERQPVARAVEQVPIDPVEVAPVALSTPPEQPIRLRPEPISEEWPQVERQPVAGPPDEASPDEITPLVAEILEGDASDQIIAELVGEIAASETSAQIIAELADEVASEEPSGIAVEPVALESASEADLGASELPETRPATDIAARLRDRLTSGRVTRAHGSTDPTIHPVDDEPVSRLARRLDMAAAEDEAGQRELSMARLASADPGGSDSDDFASRRDRFEERVHASEEGSRPRRTLLERLGEYGITPDVSGGEPVIPLADEFRNEEQRWIPPRLYELEAVRYLLLVGIVVVAATSAWIVTRTVSASGDLVDGDIALGHLDQINVARGAFVTSLSGTLGLVTLWCAVFVTHARRAGAPNTREWRIYSLLALVFALNIVTFFVDGDSRDTPSLLCVMVCLAAAMVAVTLVSPFARWLGRRTIGLVVWSAGLAFVAVISWLGGLQRPIEATDAVEALTFVAALQTIATAVVVVIAALSTSDLEDAIRLSPALAETPPSASHEMPQR